MRRQVKPAWHMERLVTTIVNDPKYLTQEFITSTDFRKEPTAPGGSRRHVRLIEVNLRTVILYANCSPCNRSFTTAHRGQRAPQTRSAGHP